jgi:hypothetical protein
MRKIIITAWGVMGKITLMKRRSEKPHLNYPEMKILINTDKTINGDERQQQYYTSLIDEELKRYQSHITRIEMHLSDQNGKKEGVEDVLCMLEARLEGRQPMAVTHQDDTVELAVSGALEKLKNALETILGRLQNHL